MKFATLILLASTTLVATGCGDLTPGGRRIPVDRAPADAGEQPQNDPPAESPED